VYRARDTTLDRDVAIKALPSAVAQDPERLARFEREAKVLAALNHRNIAQIYGVEQGALVMELVEGETLPCPLPIETALPYTRQIAEALEYAHERGVMHRDLKPANTKVTPDGTVKLLDFDLAKAIEDPAPRSDDPSNSPGPDQGQPRTKPSVLEAAGNVKALRMIPPRKPGTPAIYWTAHEICHTASIHAEATHGTCRPDPLGSGHTLPAAARRIPTPLHQPPRLRHFEHRRPRLRHFEHTIGRPVRERVRQRPCRNPRRHGNLDCPTCS
jgi:serine/threonine protein kinase